MPDWLMYPAGAVLLVAAAAYALIPLAIKATQSLGARPRYQAIAPADVAPEDVAFMSPTEEALRREGLYAVALLRSAEVVPGTSADVMLFHHPRGGDTAVVVVSRAGPMRTPMCAVETRFEDGYSVETTNFADAGVFPPNPRKHRLAIPGLSDVALLCEIHRRRRARLAPPRLRAVVPPPGGEAAELEREEAEEAARVAAAGYYALDPDGRVYRPTFKGAYLMTWKMMWPVSALRRSAKRRAARRELATLGLDPALV